MEDKKENVTFKNSETDYFICPTSELFALIMDAIIFAKTGALKEMKARMEMAHVNTKYEVFESGETCEISRTDVKSGDEIAVVFDAAKIKASDSHCVALLTYCMIKAFALISDGKPTMEQVLFGLKELVDVGVYDTIDDAREGAEVNSKALSCFQVKTSKKSDRETFLFSGHELNDFACSIVLSPIAPWEAFCGGYTLIPREFFSQQDGDARTTFFIWWKLK